MPAEAPEAIAAALREAAQRGRDGVGETREWVRRELNDRRYAERMLDVFREAIARR